LQKAQDKANILRLYPSVNNLTKLTWIAPHQAFSYDRGQRELLELYFSLPDEYELLIEVLNSIGINRVHFHHTMRLAPIVWGLPARLGVKYDYTAHDYYSICPQVSLTTIKNVYCGVPDEDGCNHCLKTRPSPGNVTIDIWRSNHRVLLEGAERVFIPSHAAAHYIKKYFSRINAVVVPHPEKNTVHHKAVNDSFKFNKKNKREKLRVLVIGALSQIKGADLLERCALDAKNRKLPLEFHLVGNAYRSLVVAPKSNLFVHGNYNQDSELPGIINNINPHLAWFPAQWPETYSYTLSAVLDAGLPVATTNLGAIAERIAKRKRSWILDWATTPGEWNQFFCKLRTRRGANSPSAHGEANKSANPPGIFSYESHYLAPIYVAAEGEKNCIDEKLLIELSANYRSSTQNMRLCVKRIILNFIYRVYSISALKYTITRTIPLPVRDKVNKWLES
jgi:glycosyltransferase involved in cell wall biosynthesis